MNILISGGAGFIGSNLALKLIKLGHKITILDNLSKQIHGENPENESPLYNSIKNQVHFIKGCVTSRSDWELAIKDQSVIVHLAAETGTGQSMYCIENYCHINLQGTAIMLDILANQPHSIDKVVVASSRSIYGEGKYKHPSYGIVYPRNRSEEAMLKKDFEVKYIDNEHLEVLATDEESKIHPNSVYGITKQNQEQMVMTVCPSLKINPVAFRYQNVYGPGQSLKNPYTGILSIFSTQIRNHNEINIFEDGSESRDFVYIDDVVNATIIGIENPSANGQVFNVGSGVPIDVLTVAKSLISNYKIEVPINVSGQFRIGDIRHNYADLNKIKTTLGFAPKFDFNSGLKSFCDWVLSQEIEEDKLSKSLFEMKSKGLFK